MGAPFGRAGAELAWGEAPAACSAADAVGAETAFDELPRACSALFPALAPFTLL